MKNWLLLLRVLDKILKTQKLKIKLKIQLFTLEKFKNFIQRNNHKFWEMRSKTANLEVTKVIKIMEVQKTHTKIHKVKWPR